MGELRKIAPLAGGGGEAAINLVDLDGHILVLKRQTERHVAAERRFQQALAKADLPSLQVFDDPRLRPDEILLEYVEASTTVGGSPSPALCERWGAAIASLHAIRSDGFLALDELGTPVPASWREFVAQTLRDGLERQRRRGDGLPHAMLARIEAGLAPLLEFEPEVFAVAHGDLHLNNALVRGGDVVLFDKAPRIWAAPPVFDLALVFTEAFPGARYVESTERAGDTERLAAFLRGYGDLPPGQVDWIDHLALLRSLRRYPSPFVPDMLVSLEAALERLGP